MSKTQDLRARQRDWSAEELTHLTEMWDAGDHPFVIGSRIGRSQDAVIQKARRLELVRLRVRARLLNGEKQAAITPVSRVNQNWTPAETDRLRTLLAAGAEVEEIAQALDRKPGAILRRSILIGMKIRRPRGRPPKRVDQTSPNDHLLGTWCEASK